MSDVNEDIVATYFELKGYFVHKNLKYTVRKKSSGDSDIDLLIWNPENNDKAIVEVKGWHNETISMSYFKSQKTGDYRGRILHFLRREASEAAENFFKSKKYGKILVLPKLSQNHDDRKKVQEFLLEKNVEVIEFKDILEFVIKKTPTNKNYSNSEFQQTIRLLSIYKFLK